MNKIFKEKYMKAEKIGITKPIGSRYADMNGGMLA